LGCEAESIVCRTHNSSAKDYIGDTESFVQIGFENGATVSYTQSFSGVYTKNEMIVIGETGMLVADYRRVSLYRKGKGEAVHTWENTYPKPEATFDGLNQLLTAMETGGEADNSAEDNLKSVALLEAAYISAKEQRIVKFQPGGWL
jgi:predicted dehydrogenase